MAACLCFGSAAEFAESYRRHLYMQVYPVEQGAGYFVEVLLHHTGGADAFLLRVVVVAAGASMRCPFGICP